MFLCFFERAFPMHYQMSFIDALPLILKNSATAIYKKSRVQENSAIKTLPVPIDLAHPSLISRQGS